MCQALKAIVWAALWICGVEIFDGLLMLTGAWLMAGGVLTAMACDTIADGLFD